MRYGCDISLKYDFGSGVPCVGVIQLGHIYAANKKLGVTEVQLRCGRKKLDSDLESIFQALDKNQMENAKVFAENVIRNRKEAINLRRFGVKMGALSAKLESAHRTQEMS